MLNKILSLLLLFAVTLTATMANEEKASSSLRRAARASDKMLHGEELRQAWMELSDEDILLQNFDKDVVASSFREELEMMDHDELHERRLLTCSGPAHSCTAWWCCMFCGWWC